MLMFLFSKQILQYCFSYYNIKKKAAFKQLFLGWGLTINKFHLLIVKYVRSYKIKKPRKAAFFVGGEGFEPPTLWV